MTQIHQALHGYSGGHRLLACSKRLSLSSQRVLRVLSDLSGPQLVAGFDHYLTGYLLGDDRLFVLSHTWYASEAKRPGSVWTHSLFLSSDVLQESLGLAPFITFFQRPTERSDYRLYGFPLDVEISHNVTWGSVHPLTSQVLAALYTDRAPVVLPALSADSHSVLHLQVWENHYRLSGEWLQFCTGSIQLRQAAIGTFDLQTIPRRIERDAAKGDSVRIILDDQVKWTPIIGPRASDS